MFPSLNAGSSAAAVFVAVSGLDWTEKAAKIKDLYSL
jgi:hypothetical protein